MNADAGGLKMTRGGALAVESRRRAHGHSELVFMQPGRNIRMSASVYVGVHPDGEPGGLAEMGGAGAEDLQLGGTLHVKQQNAGLHGEIDFVWQLSNAGEDDLLRRFATGLQYALQFAARHDVEASAEGGEQSK